MVNGRNRILHRSRTAEWIGKMVYDSYNPVAAEDERTINETDPDSDDSGCDDHTWDLGYNSGIDFCRNCPAARISGYVYEDHQQSKPWGY